MLGDEDPAAIRLGEHRAVVESHPEGRHVRAESQRGRILAAMRAAIAEGGYGAASISETIKTAGVSRKTFYAQFADKEDCFVALYDEGIGHLVGVNRLNQAGGAIMDDFDDDGLLDIVVTTFDPTGSMAFYRNTGDGKFENRTEAAGLADLLALDVVVLDHQALAVAGEDAVSLHHGLGHQRQVDGIVGDDDAPRGVGDRRVGPGNPTFIIAEVAQSHHEWWDGSGYPDGLAGRDIPLEARICAVVDVFDALTMDRPYRRAMPTETVLEMMKEESGAHFDPDVLAAFFDNLSEIEGIRSGFDRPGGAPRTRRRGAAGRAGAPPGPLPAVLPARHPRRLRGHPLLGPGLGRLRAVRPTRARAARGHPLHPNDVGAARGPAPGAGAPVRGGPEPGARAPHRAPPAGG